MSSPLAMLTQFILDGLQDAVRIAQHAGSSGAHLDVELPHWLAVEHGVKCSHLIHSHGRDT